MPPILNPDFRFDGDEDALKRDIIRFAKDKIAPYEIPKIIDRTITISRGD
jgi:hypothetical protein